MSATMNSSNIKEIAAKINSLGAPQNPTLFHVERQVERDGVEMGVLENGLPYLSERGLSKMCGIHRTVLNRLAVNWIDERTKPRGKATPVSCMPIT